MTTRTETDSIGAIEVPEEAYWGAQTQRSIENFPFPSTERMPIAIVHALALVKQAAARVNRKHGLESQKADAIDTAALWGRRGLDAGPEAAVVRGRRADGRLHWRLAPGGGRAP